MVDSPYDVYFTACLSILLTALVIWQCTRRPAGSPPGPAALPVLGNMLMFRGKDKRRVFDDLRRQYGDLFGVYFGSRLLVVLNGYDLIQEALVKNADVFTDRPQLLLRQQLCGTHGLINLSGSVYKEHRKFITDTLRKLGFGKRSIETRVVEEVKHCLNLIDRDSPIAIDPRNLICNCVANVTCSIIFGERFELDNPEFVRWLGVTEEIFKKSGSASVLNYFTILQYLPGDVFQVREIIKRFEFVLDFIHKRYAAQKENMETGEVSNFCDAYARESEKRFENDQDTVFVDKQAVMVISDLFSGSMETTATTILWALVFLARHQDVQDRMRAEIDNVLSESELPTWQDHQLLPFTGATIMEIQRCGDVTPFSLAHAVSRDIEFRGYKLPQNTIVIPFLHSVMNDPTLCPNPDEFNPSRFLDADGNLQRPDWFIPFSLGHRKCLGESLAKIEMFTFLTSIVQQYVIAPPENEPLPTLDGIVGLTHTPKPFKVRFISRGSI
ncbi:hypothetical protein ScPMuIL_011507 [Solemya velum]